MSDVSASPLGDDDVEFMMDDFQRNLGKRKPAQDPQILGESPQSVESANSSDQPWFEG
ncbi:hypothetical protein QPK13_23180 [Photorhabdus tasmaniensis]